MAKAEHPEKHS